MTELTTIPGGVCVTPGVRASGVAAGLRRDIGAPPAPVDQTALDVALVDAGRVVTAAAVQTTNQVRAHPVDVTARHVADHRARAVLLNAGSANVCTGPEGRETALASAAAVADALGCDPLDVLLCSTGVIGRVLPREPLLAAVPQAVAALGDSRSLDAARAIMTTDTVPKEAAVRAWAGDATCVVGGMAKGAGMIAPELATMLCVITTDAALEGPAAQELLLEATRRTFGRISVDECRSTNDAVLLLATGAAVTPPPADVVAEALTAVCARLAESLVRDGEGAARVLHVRVTGARTEEDALGVARAIGSSLLVKTALAGGDPNWGRVLAAMGAGPVRFDSERVHVAFGPVTVCRFGVAASFERHQAVNALRGEDVRLHVDLGTGGRREATLLTCDLTHEYVTINGEYTT